MMKSSENMQADVRRDIQSGQGISLDKQQARLDDFKSKVDLAVQNTSGTDGLVARAGSAYLAQVQSLMRDYTSSVKSLRNPPLLDMNGVADRSQLQARKETVKKFM